MTKMKEETATEKFNLQKRVLNKKQMKELVVKLVEQAFQPKVDALFAQYQGDVLSVVERVLNPKIEEYNTYVKPAIKPIEKRLKSKYVGEETIQNLVYISVDGKCGDNSYVSREDFGAFRMRNIVGYETRRGLEDAGLCSYTSLSSDSAGFDISKLKIPVSLPRLMNCELITEHNFWLRMGDDQALFEKMLGYRRAYSKLMDEALQSCSDFGAVIRSLKKAEEIYITLPNSLPFLPKEETKSSSAKATSIIASGEAERLNNMLKKAS